MYAHSDSVANLVLIGRGDAHRDKRELGKRCMATKRHGRYVTETATSEAVFEREDVTRVSGRTCPWTEQELRALYLFGYHSK